MSTNLKDMVKEVKIRDKLVGIADSFGKVAVLTPRELISRQDQKRHDELVSEFQNKGYKVIYTPSEKPKELSRDSMYDTLTSHQTANDWMLWSQTDLKRTKYIR